MTVETWEKATAPPAGDVARSVAVLLVAAVMSWQTLGAQSGEAKAMIAEVVRTGSVIVSGITFEKGSEAPASSSKTSLDALRTMLAEHDEWTFEVQVHTAEGGDPSRDETLSAARARAFVEWLTSRGIAPERLVPRGYGSSRPHNAGGRLVYERVELRKLNEE